MLNGENLLWRIWLKPIDFIVFNPSHKWDGNESKLEGYFLNRKGLKYSLPLTSANGIVKGAYRLQPKSASIFIKREYR